jgi:hypothetical protein
VLAPGDVEALCALCPGVEAWLLEEPAAGDHAEARLRHIGGRDPATA